MMSGVYLRTEILVGLWVPQPNIRSRRDDLVVQAAVTENHRL